MSHQKCSCEVVDPIAAVGIKKLEQESHETKKRGAALPAPIPDRTVDISLILFGRQLGLRHYCQSRREKKRPEALQASIFTLELRQKGKAVSTNGRKTGFHD